MKKFFTLIILVILSPGIVVGQLSEGFDGFSQTGSGIAFSLTGWTLESNGGTETWEARSSSNDNYASASAYGSQEAMDVWIVSPQIDISNLNSPTLKFDIKQGYFSGHALSVKITEQFDGTVSNSNWTDVTTSASIADGPSNTYSSWVTSNEIDLSVFQGPIYVAFQYTGDDTITPAVTTTIQIDNVIVADPPPPPSILTAGDIAVTSVLCDSKDAFQFITLVDIAEGTVVYFTDNCWTGTELMGNEETTTWTVPSGGVSAGTIYTLVHGSYPNEFSGSLSGFSVSGDQVIVYQKDSSDVITFIYAATVHSQNWTTGASGTKQTDLPTGLTDGLTAVAAGAGTSSGAEYDNAWFDPTISITGTKSEILNIVSNSSNWIGNNTRPTDGTWEIQSVTLTLSFDSLHESDVKVYPNPVQTKLNFSGLTSPVQATVFDMLGRRQLQSEVINSLDVSSLKPGLYMVEIKNENSAKVFNILKK